MPREMFASSLRQASCGNAEVYIVFVSESIAPSVYAMLMTSNRNRTKYWDRHTGLPDRKLAQPSDADW